MKLHLQWALLLLSVSLSSLTLAQKFPGDTLSSSGPLRPDASQPISLSGNLAIEGGSAPAEKAVVILKCGGEERGRGETQPKGEFMLTLPALHTDNSNSGSLNDCELYGELAGFTSAHLRLFGQPTTGIIQTGTIVLHPSSGQQSFTVSVISLAAPDKAKKAFAKGQEQEKRGKWSAASEYFRRAIDVYPRYALAWLELGRSQVQQNDLIDARQSFSKAADEDSKFVEAYIEMARLAVSQSQWKDVADATDRILQMVPDSSANFWLLNAAARYNLGDLGNAESSAVHGLRLDNQHKFPQLEYLYALLLARKQDYRAAIEHIQTYLTLSPHASDAPAAQNRMIQLQRLASEQPAMNPVAEH